MEFILQTLITMKLISTQMDFQVIKLIYYTRLNTLIDLIALISVKNVEKSSHMTKPRKGSIFFKNTNEMQKVYVISRD